MSGLSLSNYMAIAIMHMMQGSFSVAHTSDSVASLIFLYGVQFSCYRFDISRVCISLAEQGWLSPLIVKT